MAESRSYSDRLFWKTVVNHPRALLLAPFRGTLRTMTSFSLRQAAQEAGTSKSTVLRAIQSGRLSATRTDDGGYSIDPAELFRVYPSKPAADQVVDRFAGQDATAPTPAGMTDLLMRQAQLEAALSGVQAILDVERRRAEE